MKPEHASGELLAYRPLDIRMREARAYSGLAIIALAFSAVIWAAPEVSFWLPTDLGWLRIGLIVGAAAAAVATYVTVFDPLRRGRVGLARESSFLLGVFGLILGLVVGGLLLLVTFLKLRGAARLPGQVGPYPRGKNPEILEVSRYCRNCGATSSLAADYCQSCGAPLYG